MAQQYAGPVSFLPQPRRVADPAVTNVTTMPTTNATTERLIGETAGHLAPAMPVTVPAQPSSSPVFDSVYLPIQEKKSPAQRRLRTGCALVARRAYSLVLRYRLELVPVAASGTMTGLGWAQHLAGAGTGAVTGYVVATAAAAGAAWFGLKTENHHLAGIGAGAAIALADVTTAVGAGVGGASLTATALATGVGYVGWVPWLREHRKHEREVEAAKQAKVVKGAVVPNAAPVDDATLVPVLAAAGEAFRAPAPAARSPFFDDVIPFSLDGETDDINDPIRIGWDENGNPVELTMLYRHTLISGASDWGKSGILNLIIKKLLKKNHVELYGIDLKPGTPELGPWRPLFEKIASTPEEARDLLQHILARGQQRGTDLEFMSQRALAAGQEPIRKWVPGKHGTAIYVITDELAELIRQDEQLRKEEEALRKLDKENALPPEPAIATLYESGLAVLRFLGIHFIAATQQPSAKVFGGNTDARGNYANRISTRAGEAGHADFVFGRGCRGNGFTPEKLTRPGEFYLQNAEMPQISPPRCRAEWVSDRDIAADVAHLHVASETEPAARLHLVQPKQVVRSALSYPDGQPVGSDGQPSLYRLFCRLCEEHGSVTKDMLHKEGPFDSRDTVRRAVDVWLQHGIIGEKEGAAFRYSLPADEEEVADGGA